VQVNQTPYGIELYFPPLRTGYGPLALAFFGALCIIMPLLALPVLIPAGSDAGGLLSAAVIGIFIVPFPAFGAVFVVLAVDALANTLRVNVSPARIVTVRRVFGIALQRHEIACADIAAIELRPAPRYQNVFNTGARFRLVARHTAQRKHDPVVAEDLEGEITAAEMQALIARHAGLNKY
jgi:hypothetical protein